MDVKLSIRSQAQECIAYEFQEQTKLFDSERIPFCWWMGVLMTEKGHQEPTTVPEIFCILLWVVVI